MALLKGYLSNPKMCPKDGCPEALMVPRLTVWQVKYTGGFRWSTEGKVRLA